MNTRDIQPHLRETYKAEVSLALISHVTDAVTEEVIVWQNRALDPIYPIVYLDALYVRIRENGLIQNRAVYVAIGLNLEGAKEVLGLWIPAAEGTTFWLQILTGLRNRGVKDIFIICVEGLKGFREAIEAVFPKAAVQLCIVQLIRASLKFVSWKRRRELAADLRKIYSAATVQEAEVRWEEFAAKWDATYPTISQIWRRNWPQIVPFFSYAGDIRRAIYTTNAVESLAMTLRRATRMRGSLPNEQAALKLLYLGRNVARNWNAVPGWREALNRFQILWPNRMPALERL